MKFPGKQAVIAAAWPAEAAEWSELLEKLGFSERFCADNGAETLRLVRAELPDVLLADEILSVLDGVRVPMERTAALNKWKMVGEVLVPGVLKVGDINKTDGCQQAAALAEKI